MAENNGTIEKKGHEKSALYPSFTINDCYKFIKQIDSLGGKSVAYSSILGLLGLTSPTTKSFLGRISSSKQFGFITTGSSAVQLTDDAKRILYPSNESEAKVLLVDAFCNPPLYQKLIERFKGKALPQKTQLSNILMNEYRIIKQVKDSAADCFIESANYLNLLVNGILVFDEKSIIDSTAGMKETADIEIDTKDPVDKNAKIIEEYFGYNFEIPTLSKKSAMIYIPDGVNEKDLDYISFYIQNMLPVFIENLKGELKQE